MESELEADTEGSRGVEGGWYTDGRERGLIKSQLCITYLQCHDILQYSHFEVAKLLSEIMDQYIRLEQFF